LFTINNHHVNSIFWGDGNIVALGGFGNLPGDIEIWDINE